MKVLALVTFIFALRECKSLDCFSCVSAMTNRECMQKDPQTCAWGQICYNVVEIGGFSGVQYTRGCMSDSHCYNLQNLNSGRSCDQDPAICVYCCEGELCNKATAQLPLFGLMTPLLTTTLLQYHL